MRPLSSRVALLASAALLAGGVSGCSSAGPDEATGTPAKPAPVALEKTAQVGKAEAPPQVVVGVVVSLTSAPGEGSDWSAPAEGAEVAAYRYGLADQQVEVRPVDDKGTPAGARAAVRQLVSQHVAGIVLATAGDHVRAAAQAAAKAGVPVVLPYEDDPTGLPAGAWLTGPDHDQVVSGLAKALAAGGLGHPVVVDAGGGNPPGIDAVATLRLAPGGDAGRVARVVTRQTRSASRADAVVVSGPAAQQAAVVQALQGESLTVPVLLTPDALSPVFPATLTDLDGTLSGSWTTVGADAGDVAAMTPGDDGEALSAYFAALRAAAGDPQEQDFFDHQPFGTVAADADTRSHDAVVALVAAATKAGSSDAADVTRAMKGLQVTADDGLAGPALSFPAGGGSALADDDVTALQATTQDPGVRPAAEGEAAPASHLFWFAAPTS